MRACAGSSPCPSGTDSRPEELLWRTLSGILIGLVAGAAAVGSSWFVHREQARSGARTRQLMLDEARNEAEALRREAEIEARGRRQAPRRRRARAAEQRADALRRSRSASCTREDELERRLTELERREQGIADRETHVKQLQEEFKDAKDARGRTSSSGSPA